MTRGKFLASLLLIPGVLAKGPRPKNPGALEIRDALGKTIAYVGDNGEWVANFADPRWTVAKDAIYLKEVK